MRRPAAALILLLLLLAACTASDPGRRWIHAAASVTSVNNTIVDLHELGVIDDDALLGLEPYTITANTALDRAHQRLVWDGEKYVETPEFSATMDVLDAAIEVLWTLVEAERAKFIREGTP